jgi:hypothetical protein
MRVDMGGDIRENLKYNILTRLQLEGDIREKIILRVGEDIRGRIKHNIFMKVGRENYWVCVIFFACVWGMLHIRQEHLTIPSPVGVRVHWVLLERGGGGFYPRGSSFLIWGSTLKIVFWQFLLF